MSAARATPALLAADESGRNNPPVSTPRILAFAFLVFPLACAASSQQFVPLPDQSVTVTRGDLTRIYFVRDESTGVNRRELRIRDGSREIGVITTGTFLCWERTGGRSLGSASYEALDPTRGKLEGLVDLNCAPGQVYYFNVTVASDDGKPSIIALDSEQGRRLVAARRPATEQ